MNYFNTAPAYRAIPPSTVNIIKEHHSDSLGITEKFIQFTKKQSIYRQTYEDATLSNPAGI
jgi:hypothetical protein